MSEASPPVGVRRYEEDRAAVLDAIRVLGPCTTNELASHLAGRLAVMVHVHLFSLGDRGLVQWADRADGQRVPVGGAEVKKSYEPIPKAGLPAKKRRRGQARPDEPLAARCQARLQCCTGKAEVRHHRVMRSTGGGDEAANTADLCDACHRFIHANRAWAYRLGWIKRRKVAA